MSSIENDELFRWGDASGDPGALTARAASLVDAVRDVPALAPATVSRIKVDVLARRSSRIGRGLPIGLRFALLTAVVLASVATAKGTMVLWRRHMTVSPTVVPMNVGRGASSARPAPRGRERDMNGVQQPIAPPSTPPSLDDVPGLDSAPPSVPVLASDPVAVSPPLLRRPSRASAIHRSTGGHGRRVAIAAPAEPRVGNVVAGSPQPTTEAQMLAGALARLRQGHDPAGAVALLDEYARAFPHGILQSEALSARLEAVIQMDDRKTALRLLDGRSGYAGRLGSQLLLTRAELRASAGRYGDALGDFDRLLAPPSSASASASASVSSSLPPTDLERALYGRAVCLGHVGRDDRARADLNAYRKRFPDGKHATEVARLLEK